MDPALGSWIKELALRQNIPLNIVDGLLAMLPSEPANSESESSLRVRRGILQRRLAEAVARRVITPHTLDTIEALYALSPLPAAADAYRVLVLHYLTSAADFRRAVADLYSRHIVNLLRSPSKAGLASRRFASEVRDFERAAADKILRLELVERYSKSKALDAIRALVEAEYEDVGPPILDLVAAAVCGDGAEEVPSGSVPAPQASRRQQTLPGAAWQQAPQTPPGAAGQQAPQTPPGAAWQQAPQTLTRAAGQPAPQTLTRAAGQRAPQTPPGAAWQQAPQTLTRAAGQPAPRTLPAVTEHQAPQPLTGPAGQQAPQTPPAATEQPATKTLPAVTEHQARQTMTEAAGQQAPQPLPVAAGEQAPQTLTGAAGQQAPQTLTGAAGQQTPQTLPGAKTTEPPAEKEIAGQSKIVVDVSRLSMGTIPTMNEGGNSNKAVEWDPTARKSRLGEVVTPTTNENEENSKRAMEQDPTVPDYEREGGLKGKAISPPAMVESKKRKTRRWSVLEEDTLRSAVREFGKGCWKEILQNHSDVFVGRTEVNLKDKWRNMIR